MARRHTGTSKTKTRVVVDTLYNTARPDLRALKVENTAAHLQTKTHEPTNMPRKVYGVVATLVCDYAKIQREMPCRRARRDISHNHVGHTLINIQRHTAGVRQFC